MVFTTPRAKKRTVALLALLAVAFAGATIALRRYAPGLTDPAVVVGVIRDFGVLAPVAFVCLQAAQVVVAPIPGQVFAFVSGYLFGTVPGTTYSLLGAGIGSYVAFTLSRRYGREYVERTLSPAVVDRFDALSEAHGLLVLFAAFLVPGLPDDVICFVGGLSTLRIREMVLVSVLGRLPGYAVVNAAGAAFAAGRVAQTGALVLVMGALALLGYRYRDRVLRWAETRPPATGE